MNQIKQKDQTQIYLNQLSLWLGNTGWAGWNSIVGSDYDQILYAVKNAKKGRPIIEYGDGRASENIVEILLSKGNYNG